jgi:hypothetical protein
MTATRLSETSTELLDALDHTLRLTFGKEEILTETLHTGGGVMVAAADLSIDGRFMGRQVWLTRDNDKHWILGFYDFAADVEDEGVCVSIEAFEHADDPLWIAAQVVGILARLGVDRLQGE